MKQVLLVLFASLGIAAFGQDVEVRSLDPFSQLSVGEAIEVILVKGSSESARIEASGVDADRIETKVSGGHLRIEMGRGNYRNASVTVTLTYKNLKEIAISSAARVTTRGTLKTEKLRLEASSAGGGTLDIDVDDLRASVSSSGHLELSGRAMWQEVTVSSSGRYSAYDLLSEDVEVDANSAGKARVTATKSIDASANSAGSIRYKGNPAKRNTSSNSGGSTKQAN